MRAINRNYHLALFGLTDKYKWVEDPKPFILVEIPYCIENERLSKHFIKKFKEFLNTDCVFVIKWITKKVRNLFNLKSRNPHPTCKIYAGQCSCGVTYIG